MIEPKDAATLVLVDSSAGEPRVLVGKRHTRHVFLPGQFVFPGGRVDAADRSMPTSASLSKDAVRRLLVETSLSTEDEALGLALAAIRETYEETGLVIGVPRSNDADAPPRSWREFAETGFDPNIGALEFIARAITPPGPPRRFDTRFFYADIGAVTFHRANVVHADAELVELIWMPIGNSGQFDLPFITGVVLQELQTYLCSPERHHLPIPFYHMQSGSFARDLII